MQGTIIDLALYGPVFWAVYLLLAMVFVQALVASVAHRAQTSYVPGIVDETLGPESFVFRSHRTFVNSIENVPFMVALIALAMASGFSPWWLSLLSWVYVAARACHMVTYYLVATRKNPSLRSYFFMLAVFAQLVLFVMLGLNWLS
nr:MAPEG family protein [uncultured Cohaesibacter sp.]